jgi:peptidyl-prolyl cis-trans isomerase C
MLLNFIFISLLSVSSFAALDANTVATINGRPLTKAEFERRYKDNLQSFKFVAPTKQNVLNDIINFELGVQEAKSLKLDQTPEVQERINAVIYQALVEKTLTEKFKKAVDITDDEAKNFCKQNPEIKTSHVYVMLKTVALKAEEEAAYKKIQAAKDELSKGAKFEEVVAKYSSGYATAAGGDIGFQTKDKLDPSYYREASSLSVGAVSQKIVRSQYGLHIIKLTGKKNCSDINVVEFKRMVYDEKRMKIFDDFMAGLRSKAKIAVNQALVKD